MPFISVVIPMYNREELIVRALDSCLRQTFNDFEVIVVDDGSDDGSALVVKAYGDHRIKLLGHEANRGVAKARNTGIDAACGEWVVCLDSDDELAVDALEVVHRRACEVGGDVAGLRFMCRLDDGTLSPDPPLADEIWDYEKYIDWAGSAQARRLESLVVVRRSTYEHVRYPEGRAHEILYHLDFARLFLVRACSDVIRIYHQDAENQLVKPDRRRSLVIAPDQARALEKVLSRHGEAMARVSQAMYCRVVFALATEHFLCGRRLRGAYYASRCVRHGELLLKTLVTVLFGLLGPNLLSWLRADVAPWVRALLRSKDPLGWKFIHLHG